MKHYFNLLFYLYCTGGCNKDDYFGMIVNFQLTIYLILLEACILKSQVVL